MTRTDPDAQPVCYYEQDSGGVLVLLILLATSFAGGVIGTAIVALLLWLSLE